MQASFASKGPNQLFGAGVIAVGLALFLIPLYHIVTVPVSSFVTLGIGGIPVVLAIGIQVVGGWLFTSEMETAYLKWILGWWVFGMTVTVLMAFVIIGYQRHFGFELGTVTSLYIVTNNLTAGALGGLGIGYYNTRSQMQAEQLADEREKLELLVRILRHDIRNDLTVCKAMTDILPDHVDDEGVQYIESLQRAITEAVDLTRTAGELVQTLDEGEEPETKPIQLHDVLSSQIEEASSSYPDTDFEVAGELPHTPVLADEMLTSVFRNLLTNAAKHNDNSEPTVRVSSELSDVSVVVEIADNGPGIPDSQKNVIFGQGEKGLDSSGTGIGLYLVDKLMTAYNGAVRVVDNEPQGAKFIVELNRPDTS